MNSDMSNQVVMAGACAFADSVEDADVRRRVVDRVIDAGGEVQSVVVLDGCVWLQARIGVRSEIPLAERMVRSIPGVAQLQAVFRCDVDDVSGPPPRGRDPRHAREGGAR
jgi:osmotically-inducible protein OsmY